MRTGERGFEDGYWAGHLNSSARER
jgi:hypothetical protein